MRDSTGAPLTSSVGLAMRAGVRRLWLHLKPVGIISVCAVMLVVCSSQAIVSRVASAEVSVSGVFLVLAFAAVLPGLSVLLSLPLALGVLKLVSIINETKIAAVGLPVTAFDLRMVVENPTLLPNALAVDPAGVVWGLSISFLLICGLIVAGAVLARWRGVRLSGWHIAVTFTTLTIVSASAIVSLRSYGRLLPQHIEAAHPDAWQLFHHAARQAQLSRELGPLEYIAFTHALAAGGLPVVGGSAANPGAESLVRALHELGLELAREAPVVLPNIVFLHAESTFDPNAVFRLSERVELPMWSELPETKLLSPLRVNVVGGASWVTEFEVLTGVDPRVFGFQGFYTHYYIAPHVERSFVKHLGNRGYRSAAFYPAVGSYYRSELAFREYGFDDFIDAAALGLPLTWSAVRDSVVVRTVIERGAFEEEGPFFYFISTTENHGPHACTEGPDRIVFAMPVAHEEHCRLNEFVRRAGSTSAGFEAILQQLRNHERRTGRPFLLLVYGDHQPYSFTEGTYSVAFGNFAAFPNQGSFSQLRTGTSAYQTFVHLLASDSFDRHPGFEAMPPAWFLPTLVSSFVAASLDELYLPESAYVFARCGSDLVTSDCPTRNIAAMKRGLLLDPEAANRAGEAR